MSSNFLFHRPLAGAAAILAILAGVMAAQIAPAARTPDKPNSPPASLAPTVPAARISSPAPRRPNDDGQMAALIAQALDQKTDLDINETPVGDAFDLLAGQTGIPIEVAPGTFELLPYDARTLVSATIKSRPLRDSLAALLRPIGLKFEVENQRVMIRPAPPLRRLAERATWEELGLLEKLNTTSWSDEFAKSLKFQFHGSLPSPAEVNRETLLRLAANVGQGSAADVLEQATDVFGWTWYPSGDLIVVLPKARQVERQLQRRISADYTQTSLQDALLDLAERAGVPLRVDPGALASLSPFVAERFNLRATNYPVRQVLELIAGQTGLAYYIEADGVRITANQLGSGGPTTGPAATDVTALTQAFRASRSNVIGYITLPAGKDKLPVTIFLREEDLTPEQLEALKTFRHSQGRLIFTTPLMPATQPHE